MMERTNAKGAGVHWDIVLLCLINCLGTIHILRKPLCSTILNLITQFFLKNCFIFVKTKEVLFQHYILTKFSCCGWFSA
jgi:hypothetical protein